MSHIYFTAEDNPSPPSDKADLDTRPITGDGVPWVIDKSWYDNVVYRSPNLKTILQEIVDRSGFSEGNNIMAVINWVPNEYQPADAYRFWSAMEHLGGVEKACLRVFWRPAQQIQTPYIEPVVEFQLSVGFLCTITTYPTDAAIYYTTDGSDPTEGDTLYTTPFPINNSPLTVKAKAYKQYWIPSEIGQRDYTILWPGLGTAAPITGDGASTDHIARHVGNIVYMCGISWTNFGGSDQKGPTVFMYDKVNDTYSESVVMGGLGVARSDITDFVVKDNGSLHIAWSERYVTPISFYYIYYSTNESGSWVTTKVDDLEWANYMGFLTFDSSDYVHIFQIVKGGIRGRLVHITNQSGSWQTEEIDTDLNLGYVRGVIHDNDTFTITYERDYLDFDIRLHVAEGSWGSWNITQLSNAQAGKINFWHHVVKDDSDNAIIVAFDAQDDNVWEVVKSGGVWVGNIILSIDPDKILNSMYGTSRDANGNYHLTFLNAGGYDAGAYYITNESGAFQYYFCKLEQFALESQQPSHGDVGFDIVTRVATVTYRVPPVQPPLTYWVHRICLSSCPSKDWGSSGVYDELDNGMVSYSGGSVFSATYGMTIWAGELSGTEYHSFFRFVDVDVPQGATIQSAYIGFTLSSNSTGTTIVTKIRGNDVDDAVAPTTVGEFESLVLTTASVNWSFDPADAVYGANEMSSDLKTVVQEIVSRSGWVEGNAMQFVLTPQSNDGSSRLAISGFQGYTRKAYLVIRY